jgi:3-phenylpropionate/trans-cinnamate dioxygenase ferredoxin reductase subunit
LAVDAINDARAYMVGKRLVEMDRSPEISAISDTTTDLKMFLKQ